jgi:tRNA(Ile)-lysidine synthetase-like protein
MKLEIKPGKYVVAVSGGVDSMVLLQVLAGYPGIDLVVAHFDHGIRADSSEDERLVKTSAERLGLSFFSEQGRLDRNTSEADARDARYAFLRRIQKQVGAQAIITAHHQDDVLETMIINMSRGTSRKGLSSLISHKTLIRPFLHIPKHEILAYAQANNVQWREDSTNQDERYLRNYIRKHVMPRLDDHARSKLRSVHASIAIQNAAIDMLVKEVMRHVLHAGGLERHSFIMLPHTVAREVMAAWLRQEHVRDISSQQIERLVVAAKTGRLHAIYDVDRLKIMNIGRKFLQITSRDSRNTTI